MKETMNDLTLLQGIPGNDDNILFSALGGTLDVVSLQCAISIPLDVVNRFKSFKAKCKNVFAKDRT